MQDSTAGGGGDVKPVEVWRDGKKFTLTVLPDAERPAWLRDDSRYRLDGVGKPVVGKRRRRKKRR